MGVMIGLEVWKYRNSCVKTQFLDFLVTLVKEQFVIVPPVLDVGRRLTPMVAWDVVFCVLSRHWVGCLVVFLTWVSP